ncbi:hypothetical protein KCU81_g7258, partial [Aureobasidium melanogenum]|uniref:Uncharacterized protein n=1 Tax=Aureobasidium melanogenum (strain CBS 110374) TaxID=1043003 RepID=A0A074WK32_AURM1
MSNNNDTTPSAVEELRVQQQCFRDEGDRLAEDALQVRIEDAQEPLRQQETLVAASAAAVASGSRCTPRADPSDLFDACGRAWCEYHGRFTPSHSTRYCSARQAHERRPCLLASSGEIPGCSPANPREYCVWSLLLRRHSKAPSPGQRQRIAKLKAEKGSSKNLPARGPLRKDPNDDEGGPDSGASKQITV